MKNISSFAKKRDAAKENQNFSPSCHDSRVQHYNIHGMHGAQTRALKRREHQTGPHRRHSPERCQWIDRTGYATKSGRSSTRGNFCLESFPSHGGWKSLEGLDNKGPLTEREGRRSEVRSRGLCENTGVAPKRVGGTSVQLGAVHNPLKNQLKVHSENKGNATNHTSITGSKSFTYTTKNPTKYYAKLNQEKSEKIQQNERELTSSMRNLSIGISTIPVARAVAQKLETTSYIRRNLFAWAERVFAKVGPGHKEIKYHVELKNLLLSKGFDVGYEVPLKFERLGSKPIAKRVDLIVSMPDIPQKVLIECKAKKKLEKKDYKQVLFYQQHFGIQQCYLVNFRVGTVVKRLE